jgi:FkbM family methyltransferase
LNNSVPKILDVGANIVLFSLAARLAFPQAVIHAYEPNFQLKLYLDHHSFEGNFIYFLEAIGPQDGYTELIHSGDSNLTQVRISESSGTSMTSFHDALARIGGMVDLLKLDCEGTEWSLFKLTSLWSNIHNVSMEYHLWATDGLSHNDTRRIIEGLGFEVLYQACAPDFGLLRARQR